MGIKNSFVTTMVILCCFISGCAASETTKSDISVSEKRYYKDIKRDDEITPLENFDSKKKGDEITPPENSENKKKNDISTQEDSIHLPTGDLAVIQSDAEGVELSEKEVVEAERAVRDYKPSASGILKNNAKQFYYHDQLASDERELYDAILTGIYDSYEAVYPTMFYSKEDPSSDGFNKKFNKVYWSMLYDHPELFWFYNCDESLKYSYNLEKSSDSHPIYISVSQPYINYVDEINDFNNAVKHFLDGINLNAPEQDIALQIHDNLIGLVLYNYDVFENKEQRSHDRAHTAYGALVEDSLGNSNYAVCDGYSAAYLYLLQQAGIEGVILCGEAGSGEDDMGGHAWNVVQLGEKWFEIDSTWNDFASVIEHSNSSDNLFYTYANEAFTDPVYRNKREHYMYGLSTNAINDYKVTEDLKYISNDGGYSLYLAGDSTHVRESELNTDSFFKQIVAMAPIAYESLTSESESEVPDLTVVTGVTDPSTNRDIYIPGATESSYLWPDADSKQYSESDLGVMTEGQIRYLINEIYAREGYTFDNDSWKNYFEQKDWYTASVSNDEFNEHVNSYLNDYEYQNVELLKDYQVRNGFQDYR